MNPKDITIVPPEGFEIDKENSTFECIKFKPKKLTYEDVAKALFKVDKLVYFPGLAGTIRTTVISNDSALDADNAKTKKQWEKLMALNKLINVAKYLNGDWVPDFSGDFCVKWFIAVINEEFTFCQCIRHNLGTPCFKSKDLAKQAVEILGEETVKLALSQV